MRLQAPKIRSDLVYVRDSADASYFFVKDPIRAQFFRFNELQIGMMKALDGERKVPDVVEHLGEIFEIEVPEESVQRMIIRLEKDLLLDITSYRVRLEEDRKKIRRALRKKGLVWRSKKRETPTLESELFDCGITQIERGDPCLAAKNFAEVLSINPQNARARTILDTLHKTYFNRFRPETAGLFMLQLANPDRFLTRLDKAFGRILFSAAAVVVLFFLFLAATQALLTAKWPEIESIRATDVVLYLPMLLIWLAIHELGHGLSCKHYGGTVTDMGVMLMFGVIPGAYCDTSDTYLFRKRSQKVIVSLAGIYASVAVNVVLAFLFCFTSDDFFLRRALAMLLLFGFWNVFQNLVPLIKLDGYYALADLLGIHNLRERAIQHVVQTLRRTILGIPATESSEDTPREKRVFWIFGISAATFSVLYVYQLWICSLLPYLIRHLGIIGVLITLLYALQTFRKMIFRPFLSLGKLLFQHRARVFSLRRSLAFVAFSAAMFGVLSIRWPFYVDGTLVIEPRTKQVVKAQESGLFRAVVVHEGQVVHRGDVLAHLTNGALSRDRQVVEQQLIAARAKVDMLKGGARREELDIAEAKVRGARVEARKNLEVAKRAASLNSASLLATSTVLRAEREAQAANGERVQESLALALLEAGSRVEDIVQAEATMKQLELQAESLDARLASLTLTSPIDGVVSGRGLDKLLGARIERGASFCEIEDVAQVVGAVAVPPSEVFGDIAEGQAVVLRTYADSDRAIESKIDFVSPATTLDGSLIVRTELFDNPGWRSGISGHARIYGSDRTIAYRIFEIPVLRLIEYDAGRFSGG